MTNDAPASPAFAELLAEAEAAGVRLRLASDGKLQVTGAASLELLGRLHAHRDEILELLRAEAAAVSPDALAAPAELTVRGGPLP